MKILTLALFASVAFAGQSIILISQNVQNTSASASALNSYAEAYHDVVPSILTTNPTVLVSNGSNRLEVILVNGCGSVCFQAFFNTELGASATCSIQVGNLGPNAFYWRVDHDNAALGAGHSNADDCTVWTAAGVVVGQQSWTYTSIGSNFPGVYVGGGADAERWAFVRLCSGATLPLSYRMPTTAGGCAAGSRTFEWKFDGTLNDSSGNGFTGVLNTGSQNYAATLYQNAISVPATAGHPFWSNWTSFRAGHANQLDGSASLSQADASNAVTCSWVMTGASTPTFNDPTLCVPTVTNIVFGSYTATLTVTDVAGNHATTALPMGAVAMDNNGVVIQSDPNADIIFGPMIAFGKNPWGWEDYNNLLSSNLLNYGTPTQYWTWLTTGQGTVSYLLGGKGCGVGSGTGTTLHTSITGTSMSIVVDDASQLDLSELPTRILLCPSALTQVEEVRISATTGMSGQQTLTVPYFGRASSATGYGGNYYLQTTPQSYSAGATVGQYKIKGASTKFLTDTNRPMCPVGAGPAGALDYSTGTATLTAGSATVTGVGTAWTSQMVGDRFRSSTTTHSSTPFTFAAIVTAASGTSMTLDQPYPSTADTGTFSYALILPNRFLSTEYLRVDGSTGRFLSETTGCESETSVYGAVNVDMGVQNGTSQTGQLYSWKSSLGVSGPSGPDFYGTPHMALYLRSGLQSALDKAQTMDGYWVKDPELDGGWHGGIPLLQGGGVIFGMTCLILNHCPSLAWSDVRQFVAVANSNSTDTCNQIDTRDSGYYYGWLTLGYLFDPDSSSHTTWKNGITNVYNRDTATVNPITGATGCKGADNSWANGAIFNTAGPRVNVTHNSAVVTTFGGDTFSASGGLGGLGSCGDHAHGSGTVTNGSASITGSGFVNLASSGVTPQIVVTGTLSGSPFVQFFPFNFISSSSGTLAAQWVGDSGSVTWILRPSAGSGASPDFASLGASVDDPLLLKSWACVYNSTSQITLNTPWTGSTDTSGTLHWFPTYSLTGQSLSGYGQQPYMLGIRGTFMRWLATGAPGAMDFTTQYSALAGLAGDWMYNVAFSQPGYVFSYGRDYQACEPTVVDAGLGYSYRNGGACQSGLEPTTILPLNRQITAEAGSALRNYFAYHGGNSTALAFGDHAYGGLWGNPTYTTGGVYSDASFAGTNTNVNPSDLGGPKYPGFFFAMGMSHQWPAIRVSLTPPPPPFTRKQSGKSVTSGTAR